MELGSKTGLNISYPLLEVVHSKLIGNSLQCLRGLHDCGGVVKPLEVIDQVLVAVLEHQFL